MTTPLGPEVLYRACDPATVPFDTTADERDPIEIYGHERVVEAADLAVRARHRGYNLFALGPDGLGKRTLVRKLLAPTAAGQPVPLDWCYVNNFREPLRPRALRLPAGTGRRLRADLQRAIAELGVALPAAFDSDEYRTRKAHLAQEFGQRHQAAFEDLQGRARARQVALVRTDSGMALTPLRGDEPIDGEAFARLPEAEQAERRANLEQIGGELAELFRHFHDWAREHLDAVKSLDREIATSAVRGVIGGVRAGYPDQPAVAVYLDEVEVDVIDNAERFVKAGEDVPEPLRRALHRRDDDGEFRRYQVNVLVDHQDQRGAPIVEEDTPTLANLIGRVEHVAELGALVTEFNLIRPGALHRANGGYLLLDAVKVLQHPFAWDGLKRALRSQEIRIEHLGQALGVTTTVALEPEPIPLDVKVVLFGDRLVYYLLAALDPEFADLFKVMADFDDDVVRTPEAEAGYARLLAHLVRRAQLRPFDRAAIARVIEFAARLTGDGGRLSLVQRPIEDLLREADLVAATAGRAVAGVADVDAAIDAQRRRRGRAQARWLDAVADGTILIDTDGDKIGQINGLSVVELGGHGFGHPARITARARVGDGRVLDIEREVELGGPIHSKGVMIVGGLLGERYARHRPLALSASIVFEQSYGQVEGDSASLAELCALLSAIGQVPIDQALAFTGSLDQLGDVQPIGGVNEKIEGFFDVCRRRGLTGRQGVVIPRANLRHLMLRADVVAAVAAGQFRIVPVATLDEALAVATGLPAGVRDATGRYPEGTVNAMVEARLHAFAEDVRRFAEPPGRKNGGPRSHRWS